MILQAGAPKRGIPIHILLAYHCHTNPLKYGNCMGPAYGKGGPTIDGGLCRIPKHWYHKDQRSMGYTIPVPWILWDDKQHQSRALNWYTLENDMEPKKSLNWKGKSSSEPPFMGSMFVLFKGVPLTKNEKQTSAMHHVTSGWPAESKSTIVWVWPEPEKTCCFKVLQSTLLGPRGLFLSWSLTYRVVFLLLFLFKTPCDPCVGFTFQDAIVTTGDDITFIGRNC